MFTTAPIPTTAGIAVALRSVRRAFAGGVVAIERLSADIPPGQFVALLGPSGCGKSTLLRLVAGLDRAQGGRVLVEDGSEEGGSDESHLADLGRRGEIAYVFQDPHLMPWRNVLRNVALPLELRGVTKGERLDAARAAIEQVGLTEAARRYPAQLSGGMRMRVSLARALVTRPRLLLLDEPFAALDEMTRQRLDEQLYELWFQRRMTVLFVTHSLSEAAFLAQRALVLSQRPARLVADVTVDLPPRRCLELRTDPRFNELVRRLYRMLEREGA